MNPYSILMGLTAVALLYAAWHEWQEENRRKAVDLTLAGTGMGALAAAFAYVLRDMP